MPIKNTESLNHNDIEGINSKNDENAYESDSPVFCDLRIKDQTNFSNAFAKNVSENSNKNKSHLNFVN